MTGEEIRNARKQLGLTQAEFAVVMGLPGNTYVSNLEAERERLSKPAQILLSIYLDGYRPTDWPEGK